MMCLRDISIVTPPDCQGACNHGVGALTIGLGGSMRASTLSICFALLCLVSAPVAADPPVRTDAVTQKHAAPVRRAANADELARYAKREQAATKQAKFEGGRGYYIEASTVIIILLVVIRVIIL